VLKAVKPITAGETVADAQSAGAIELGSVPKGDLLPDSLTSLDALNGKVALTNIYPAEQIITSKFGATAAGNTLSIPKGKLAISVNLTDPARVAGFVNPGDQVTIFMDGTDGPAGAFTRMLLPKVQVIGVGTTTVVSTTTTDATGAQTTEQLPRTLLTLAVSQAEAQKVLFASTNGDLAFGLLNSDSVVAANPGVTSKNLFQ
jgi:pilus assembly protein CpaB